MEGKWAGLWSQAGLLSPDWSIQIFQRYTDLGTAVKTSRLIILKKCNINLHLHISIYFCFIVAEVLTLNVVYI